MQGESRKKEALLKAPPPVVRHYSSQSNSISDERDHLLLQGVSVHWLKHGFLKEVEEAGLNSEATIVEIEDLHEKDKLGVIRRKGKDVQCPVYNRVGAAYVHCLNGEDNVGKATHMLSYSWGYTIGDIVDALEAFCEGQSFDPKRTYIWICCLCINQHKVVDDSMMNTAVPTNEFLASFQARVLGIGRLICMMAPWENPRYLSRVWCIFEIHTAMKHYCEVSIEMPRRERERMFRSILFGGPKEVSGNAYAVDVIEYLKNGFMKEKYEHDDGKDDSMDVLFAALANTKVEEAQASVKADRDMILDILSKEEGGYAITNSRVNEYFRSWITSSLEGMLAESKKQHDDDTDKKQLSTQEFASRCSAVGRVLFSMEQYPRAFEILHYALELEISVLPEQHPSLATTHHNLGMCYMKVGHFQESLVHFEETLAIEEAALGEKHIRSAMTVQAIGDSLYHVGRYDDALEQHHKALYLLEERFGSDHPNNAKIHHSIAACLTKLGRHEEALRESKKGLAMEQAILPTEHPDVATTHRDIGGRLAELDQLEEAEVEYNKALVIFEKLTGPTSTKTAACHDGLARVLERMGRMDEARLHRARRDEALDESSDTGTEKEAAASYIMAYNRSLQEFHDHFDAKQYEEAASAYSQALEFAEKGCGRYHPDVVQAYTNFGCVLETMGMLDRAVVEHRRGVAIEEVALGLGHPNTARSYSCIGEILEKMGRHEEALLEYQTALAIEKETLGADHARSTMSYEKVRDVLHKLGTTFRESESYEKALSLHKKALYIHDYILGQLPNPPYFLGLPDLYQQIGLDLCCLGRYEEALGAVRKAVMIHEDRHGKEHPFTGDGYKSLGTVYESMGHNEKSLIEYQKALNNYERFLAKASNGRLKQVDRFQLEAMDTRDRIQLLKTAVKTACQ